MAKRFLSIFFCTNVIFLVFCNKAITRATFAPQPIPSNFQDITVNVINLDNEKLSIKLFAHKFAQGNVVYVEIITKSEASRIRATFNGKTIPLSKREWGWRGFFPIAPDLNPEKYVFSVTIDSTYYEVPVVVEKTHFPVSTIPMDLGKFSSKEYIESPEAQEFIKISTQKKQNAFSIQFDDLIRSRPSHPRDTHEISSMFWAKRVYMLHDGKTGKTQTTERIHRGIDLKGKVGDPVYAMLDGIVVLAEMLFFEGNMVIINHGNSIFSYYMHLNEIKVQSGDKVVAGQLIGTVGSTGMSTGPHLHVSLVIDGIQVNPLSIIPLPIR